MALSFSTSVLCNCWVCMKSAFRSSSSVLERCVNSMNAGDSAGGGGGGVTGVTSGGVVGLGGVLDSLLNSEQPHVSAPVHSTSQGHRVFRAARNMASHSG